MGHRSAIRGNNAPCYFDGFDVAHGKIGSRLISRTNCDRLRLIDLENSGVENRSILTAEGTICVRQAIPIRTLALPAKTEPLDISQAPPHMASATSALVHSFPS